MTTNQKRKIVVDTSFFDSLYRLKVFGYLNLFFSSVFLPAEVEREFLSEQNEDREERFRFLNEAFNSFAWFRKCNTYDPFDINFFSTAQGIDPGEAEVLAQTKGLTKVKKSNESIISGLDEKRGRAIARGNSIEYMGVLKVIAYLHLLGFLHYEESVRSLVRLKKRFSAEIIGLALREAQEEFKSGMGFIYIENAD